MAQTIDRSTSSCRLERRRQSCFIVLRIENTITEVKSFFEPVTHFDLYWLICSFSRVDSLQSKTGINRVIRLGGGENLRAVLFPLGNGLRKGSPELADAHHPRNIGVVGQTFLVVAFQCAAAAAGRNRDNAQHHCGQGECQSTARERHFERECQTEQRIESVNQAIDLAFYSPLALDRVTSDHGCQTECLQCVTALVCDTVCLSVSDAMILRGRGHINEVKNEIS